MCRRDDVEAQHALFLFSHYIYNNHTLRLFFRKNHILKIVIYVEDGCLLIEGDREVLCVLTF